MIKNIFAAAVIVGLASTAAVAQGTDHGSSLGGGGGASGSIASYLPAGLVPVSISAGVGNAREAFLGVTGAGRSVPNPAGGSVVVPQAAVLALAGVLGGSPSAAQSQALNEAFGSTASGNALTNALTALGASPSLSALQSAIGAYNTAITALPGNAPPTPALLAARQALATVASFITAS